MKRMFAAALLLAAPFSLAADLADPVEAMRELQTLYEPQAVERVLKNVAARADAGADTYLWQQRAAEAHLLVASRARMRRSIGVSSEEEAELRKTAEHAADAAMPYATRALALATSPEEQAQAHRVLGELYSHQITGPVSGMKKGPQAREHIEMALRALPEDPECMRANGMMYLHNPVMFGGDPKRAADVFRRCAELRPDEPTYLLLLAIAFRKLDQPEQALEAANAAQALAPKDPNIVLLLERLKMTSSRARQEAQASR